MGMNRIIIAGSRNFKDYELMKNEVIRMLHFYDILLDETTEIVSGHADGADRLGEKFAEQFGYKLKIFHADWDKYGRAAGPIRNEQMAKYAAEADFGMLIAFPIGSSRGTRNMIKLAHDYDLVVKVVENK